MPFVFWMSAFFDARIVEVGLDHVRYYLFRLYYATHCWMDLLQSCHRRPSNPC